MKYEHTVLGRFLERPNRFIAYVEVNGQRMVCHVKNTGRCRELLIPGCRVVLEYHPGARAAGRKTEFDLIAVYKGDLLINMDSQAPNKAAWEWMEQLCMTDSKPADCRLMGALWELQPWDRQDGFFQPGNLRREVTHGDSRFDLAFTLQNEQTGQERPAFMEVKGVTLEKNGIVMFPDAPTQRGIKHIQGLSRAIREGFEAFVLFVVQMNGVTEFRPNDKTYPAFGDALRAGADAGVHILAYDCRTEINSLVLQKKVAVRLSADL